MSRHLPTQINKNEVINNFTFNFLYKISQPRKIKFAKVK